MNHVKCKQQIKIESIKGAGKKQDDDEEKKQARTWQLHAPERHGMVFAQNKIYVAFAGSFKLNIRASWGQDALVTAKIASIKTGEFLSNQFGVRERFV